MTGIIFFQTAARTEIVSFYQDRLTATRWLEQEAGCTILQIDNLLIGFCDADQPSTDGIITIARENRDAVDQWYQRLEDVAQSPPEYNADFDIYQFFASDPEGRTIEVQSFEHEIPPVPSDD